MQLPILHGDVSFHPITELPKGLKKIDLKDTKYVVAHGESGHLHQLVLNSPADVDIYIDPATGLHVLQFHNQATITHEEHKTLTIEPGIFIEKREQEYNPFKKQLEQVQD